MHKDKVQFLAVHVVFIGEEMTIYLCVHDLCQKKRDHKDKDGLQLRLILKIKLFTDYYISFSRRNNIADYNLPINGQF